MKFQLQFLHDTSLQLFQSFQIIIKKNRHIQVGTTGFLLSVGMAGYICDFQADYEIFLYSAQKFEGKGKDQLQLNKLRNEIVIITFTIYIFYESYRVKLYHRIQTSCIIYTFIIRKSKLTRDLSMFRRFFPASLQYQKHTDSTYFKKKTGLYPI